MKHLIIVTFALLIFANGFSQSKPPRLVDRDFVFDTTATYLINQRKYYKAAEFYIISTSVSNAVKQRLQGKLVNVFGVIQNVQGKTLAKQNGKKVPAKDLYTIIENPRIKEIARDKYQKLKQNTIDAFDPKTYQKERLSEISADTDYLNSVKEKSSDKSAPDLPDLIPKMPVNDEVNFVSDGVVYSDNDNQKSNSTIDIRRFPSPSKTYPFMKNWQFVNHISFKAQWVTIVHNSNQNSNKLENLSTKEVVNVIIAETANNDTIRIINIDYQKKIPTTVFRLFVAVPKQNFEGVYTLPAYKEKGVDYINAFGLDNTVRKTYFLSVLFTK